jgi:hypothetical protein
MKLSIYVNLRAIGWNITDGISVVKAGIKRLNISFDNYYEYISGLPVTKRINKRMKAQQRRNLWRYKSRRSNLIKLLVKNGYSSKQEYSGDDMLKLRVKALNEKLSNDALFHVFMSLQKKRGYKTLRGVDVSENSEYLKQIDQHEENLKQYPSIAAYMLTISDRKNVVLRRASYIAEFDKICQKQEITGDFYKQLYNAIYYQRPLKKPVVSKCKYEKNREVCHSSNPQYQEFRIWRDVMNIELFAPDGTELEISLDIRRKWQSDMMCGINLTKPRCLKDLGIKKAVGYNWYSGKLLAGHPVIKEFKKIGYKGSEFTLWQDVFSATDDEFLSTLLLNKYKLSADQVSAILDLNFHALGYADFSTKAIKKLLPLMEQGMKLKEAIMQVYGKVDFEEVHLRNVILEQHYFSVKSLADALKKEFEITEVAFEIDPLLKAGNKNRKEMAKNKRKTEKWQKENHALTGGNSYNELKLQLWEEQKGVCPYQPDKPILMEELFTDKYNIDHIVPKSKIYERSYVNNLLCPADLNEQKNRMTGIEFAEFLGVKEKYLALVETYSEAKKHFLLMNPEDIPDNYVSQRQSSDYNTKCFATIAKGSVNIPNKLISRYLKEWKFNKYPDGDARQALAKSFVIASMSQETITYFDTLKVHGEGIHSLNLYDIQPDIKIIDVVDVIETAPVFMPRIKRVRKSKFGYYPKGTLHAETVFGQRKEKFRNSKGEIIEKIFYKVRQPLAKLTPNMVSNIMDKAIQRIIMQRIEKVGSHEAGILDMLETPPYFNGKPIKRISIRQNSDALVPLHSTDGNGITGKAGKFGRKIDFVSASSYYATSVSNVDGKPLRKNIRLIDFVNNLNGLQDVLTADIWLKQNDILEINGKQYFIIGPGDAMSVRPVYQLNAKDEIKLKAENLKHIKLLKVNQIGDIIKVHEFKINDATVRSYTQLGN